MEVHRDTERSFSCSEHLETTNGEGDLDALNLKVCVCVDKTQQCICAMHWLRLKKLILRGDSAPTSAVDASVETCESVDRT